MFEPNFRYTDKMVKYLNKIAEARTIIMNSPLIPKWEISLRKRALLSNAHSSTAIEGNILSLEEVTALSEGRDIMVKRKDKQEVLNYLKMLDKIPEFAKLSPFQRKHFFKIHKIIVNNTLNNTEDEGKFRTRQVVVGNRFTGEIVFRPPQTKEVAKLVDKFLNWLNSTKIEGLNPVIVAGIAHYEIVRIHPFIDGNGRIARIIATLILYKSEFDIKRFFALDDYYDQDRSRYYNILKSIDQSTLDLTNWLEYFTQGFLISIEAVKKRILGLSKDIEILKEQGQVALNERQMKIVEFILKNGKITNKNARELFGLS
ncbi:Fic family protein, partial [bacterium]|nr:Fic family protein [bacterium]